MSSQLPVNPTTSSQRKPLTRSKLHLRNPRCFMLLRRRGTTVRVSVVASHQPHIGIEIGRRFLRIEEQLLDALRRGTTGRLRIRSHGSGFISYAELMAFLDEPAE